MKFIAVGALLAGLATFGISLILPANNDWLGFFWLIFAAEVVLRGPHGTADYPLFLLVCSGNLLAALAPFAFAGASSWGRLAAHLLLLAAFGAIVACLRYHPATWAVGFYVWIASLGILATAIYLHAVSVARPVARDRRRELAPRAGMLHRTRER